LIYEKAIENIYDTKVAILHLNSIICDYYLYKNDTASERHRFDIYI